MRRAMLTLWVALTGIASCATVPVYADDSKASTAGVAWDAGGVARILDEARETRARGDLMLAERLCYTTFEAVDRSALDNLGAYVELLKAEHRDLEHEVREQVDQLRRSKADQKQGTQPNSVYLGFSPKSALDAYADLLLTLGQPDESSRMRSLALAYQQVQQAHFQRTLLFRQGKDPRGAC